MIIKIDPKSFFVFDLDDTLSQEIDYLKSAYDEIAADLEGKIGRNIHAEMLELYQKESNVFQWIIDTFPNSTTIEELLMIYRNHFPKIAFDNSTSTFLNNLNALNVPLGIITDGRSITQRNKLKALGLDEKLCEIVISEEFGSEKPNINNYIHFSNKYPEATFYFFGDNLKKDFEVPLKFGWSTFCLRDKGFNIHKQDTKSISDNNLIIIDSFDDIVLEV